MVFRAARELLPSDDAPRVAIALPAVQDRLAQVRRVLQQLGHDRRRPRPPVALAEPAGELRDRLAVTAALEQLGHQRPAHRVAHQAAHRPLDLLGRETSPTGAHHEPVQGRDLLELRRELQVARRRSRQPHAALPRARPRDRPLVARVLTLVLRQRLQLREQHPPRRRLEVHVALRGEQPTDPPVPVAALDELDDLPRQRHRAHEPVVRAHHNPIGLSRAHPLDHGLQPRPVHEQRAARDVLLVEVLALPVALRGDPRPAVLQLRLRRAVRIALTPHRVRNAREDVQTQLPRHGNRRQGRDSVALPGGHAVPPLCFS